MRMFAIFGPLGILTLSCFELISHYGENSKGTLAVLIASIVLSCIGYVFFHRKYCYVKSDIPIGGILFLIVFFVIVFCISYLPEEILGSNIFFNYSSDFFLVSVVTSGPMFTSMFLCWFLCMLFLVHAKLLHEQENQPLLSVVLVRLQKLNALLWMILGMGVILLLLPLTPYIFTYKSLPYLFGNKNLSFIYWILFAFFVLQSIISLKDKSVKKYAEYFLYLSMSSIVMVSFMVTTLLYMVDMTHIPNIEYIRVLSIVVSGVLMVFTIRSLFNNKRLYENIIPLDFDSVEEAE